MRIKHSLLMYLLALTTFFAGCAAPLLLMSPQAQLMMTVIKPMIGLDPSKAGFFEQPVIQERLKPLLGPFYDDTITILKTAEKIQQEGPLVYMLSKDSPLPQVAEKAGLVYNTDTNQLAVLLVSGGNPQIFAEKLTKEATEQVPVWPKELEPFTSVDKLKRKAVSAVASQLPVDDRTKSLMESAANDGVKQTAAQEIANQQATATKQIVEDVKATTPVANVLTANEKLQKMQNAQQRIQASQQKLATAKSAKDLKQAQQELDAAKAELKALQQTPTTTEQKPH